jgi:hypothetical protein
VTVHSIARLAAGVLSRTLDRIKCTGPHQVHCHRNSGRWNTSLHVSQCPGGLNYLSASRGVQRRVFAANPRRIAATKAEVLDVPFALRRRDGIGWPAHLIIGAAVIPNMMVSAMMIRPEHARVLGEYRRGDGGGKDNNGAENFELFGHGVLRLTCDVHR